ncbi:hypothetical protein [Rhodospirillaceae bacterium SYSU D60014]|uniref:hypothetical protein n=1 Tax=Virgifigura deserti TaxID=2268457 RepID=UPI0013C3FE68
MTMSKTFEEVYPSYPFSEMVRLAVSFGALLGGMRRPANDAMPSEGLIPEGAD